MKIAHICLSNFYVDGFGYQENDLVREHVAAGHDVLVLASTETIRGDRTTHGEPGSYLGGDGAQVIRAQVPQAELFTYATELRSITGGRGRFSQALAHYEEVPAHVAQKVIEGLKAMLARQEAAR